MTSTSYISLLRDYAAAARRRKTSYASAVHALVALRVEAIAAKNASPEETAKAQEEARQIARREYGKEDSAFTFDAVG